MPKELELAIIIIQIILGAITIYHAYKNEASLVRQFLANLG